MAIVSPCDECGKDQLALERELGALAQAARNLLLSGDPNYRAELNRLAAVALHCKPLTLKETPSHS